MKTNGQGNLKPIFPGQQGFALASVLGIMVVLAILGSVVYRNVGTDITHSAKVAKRIRAEFAAESATQWALAELSRTRAGALPFTLATHSPDGNTAFSGQSIQDISEHSHNSEDAEIETKKLVIGDLANFPGAKMGIDNDGWFYKKTSSASESISGGKQETISFKAWYPNDSTLRVTGKSTVDGSSAELNLISNLKEVAIPF
jgi:hypothetical protein